MNIYFFIIINDLLVNLNFNNIKYFSLILNK